MTPGVPPTGGPRHPLTWLDGLIAVVVAVTTFVVLAATAVMGYARDESFYFKYATVYQDWFERVRSADDPHPTADDPGGGALGRRDVLSTWRENFEHPPLMKALFGWSWRTFGVKRRPISRILPAASSAALTGLDESDGFRVGDTVTLLAPVPNTFPWARTFFDTPEPPARPAELGTAVVKNRERASATLEFSADVDLEALAETCKEPAAPQDKPPAFLTGCQAASRGPLQAFDEANALRLPTWVFFALLIAILYLFGTELFGRTAGLFAGLAFLCTPHHFFHGHLCTFDMPVTTLIVATVWAFWKSLRSRVWIGITAVLWGLSLLTKLNGYFVPVPLVIAWLAPWLLNNSSRAFATVRTLQVLDLLREHRRPVLFLSGAFLALMAGALVGSKSGGLVVACLLLSAARLPLALPPIPRAFLWMLWIGLPMQFLLWPALWFDPAQGFAMYVSFHTGHVHYPQEYFGDLLNVPPFPSTYPFVMTLLTVPVPIQLVMVVGLVTLFVTHRREVPLFERTLLFGNALLPIGLIALPSTPIFGGVKHWMATLAFGALIGGFGFSWLSRRALEALRRPWARQLATACLLALTLASGAYASVRYVAAGTGYWNELIGGLQGAADHRMMRKFWGFVSAYALDYVNVTAPRNAAVAFHESTWDAVEWYQRVGVLRRDLHFRRDPTPNCRSGDLYLFHHQGPMAQDEIEGWQKLETIAPILTWSLDAVPMLSVYQCREPGRLGQSATQPEPVL